ncbi:hypothetical protein [Streptococcus mitis]|uniref:hypothetical protein n=1 Tax=Streptococcus mitis TaxID=28037 RepID=UPI0021B69BF7|nr:hypothetical protein [Streptococcus mitis]
MFFVTTKENQKIKKLKNLYRELGFTIKIMYINCFDNFDCLTDGEFCPFTYFVNKEKGQPLFLNQLSIPSYWEITTDGYEGFVYDRGIKKATILFQQPISERWISKVCWLNDLGEVTYVDYYGMNGWRFCRELVDDEGVVPLRTIYNDNGDEVIVEWTQQNKISCVTPENKPSIYLSHTMFVKQILTILSERENICIMDEEILELISSNRKYDIYYWASNLEEANRVKDKVNNVILNMPKLEQKSPYNHLYGCTTVRVLDERPQAVIMTNSEWIEGLEELLINFPEIDFHVGAVTEMGSRITNLSIYSNLYIYPGISYCFFQEILDKSVFYLDIQYDNEIFESSSCAVEKGVLLITLKNLTHFEEYKKLETCYGTVDILVKNLRQILNNPESYAQLVLNQSKILGVSSVEDYFKVFDEWEEKRDCL